MKILIKNHIFSGGAPRSLLQYGIVMKNENFDVVTAGEITSDLIHEKYLDAGINVHDIKAFENRKIFSNILSFFKLIKIAKCEKPNIIISTDGLSAAYCSIIASYFDIGLIIVRAGGPSYGKCEYLNIWHMNELIVFSTENMNYYLEHNYPADRISLISNRINQTVDLNFIDHYKKLKIKEEPIRLLYVSRLVEDKKKSALTVFKITEELSNYFENIELLVVGNGNCKDYLEDEANKINSKKNKEVIRFVGHANDVYEYNRQAHIIFGKGRSVLSPIMMNRLGVVVGENDSFSICNTSTIQNLYEYNFAGRNMSNISKTSDLKNILNDIIEDEFEYSYISQASDLVRRYYSSEYLEEKITPIVKRNIKNPEFNKRINVVFLYRVLSVTVLSIKDYVERKFGKYKFRKY